MSLAVGIVVVIDAHDGLVRGGRGARSGQGHDVREQL
jgi:hypothetical protein